VARDSATVIITDRSFFQANQALEQNSGGVAATYDSSRTLVSGHTVFKENNATGSGKHPGLMLLLLYPFWGPHHFM
jgi:hypothetical protein